MKFDSELLEQYHTLLQTTELQQGYREFVQWFRYLRSELERQMPAFRFQNSITENAMDYAYFSFTSPELREKGLKLVVAFVHKTFCLELWLSGINRGAQCRWASRLRDCPMPMELSQDPAATDYLLRMPVQAVFFDGEADVASVQAAIDTVLGLLDRKA